MNELFEPYHNLLSLKIEDTSTREELNYYSEALNKLVAIGTHLLKWELQDDLVSLDERIMTGATFKRLLEILDAIALQVKAGAIPPAIIQLRVLFELSVQFEYLLEGDTNRRCHCFCFTDWCRQLEELKKRSIPELTLEENNAIIQLESFINNPKLNLIKAEYDRLKLDSKTGKPKKSEIKWYNLFENNLSDFSKLIDLKFSKYKMHYRYINKGFGNDAVHSTNLLSGNLTEENGFPVIIQMRNHTEALALTGIAFSIGKAVFELFVERRNSALKSRYISAIMQCEKAHKYVAYPGLSKLKSY